MLSKTTIRQSFEVKIKVTFKTVTILTHIKLGRIFKMVFVYSVIFTYSVDIHNPNQITKLGSIFIFVKRVTNINKPINMNKI